MPTGGFNRSERPCVRQGWRRQFDRRELDAGEDSGDVAGTGSISAPGCTRLGALQGGWPAAGGRRRAAAATGCRHGGAARFRLGRHQR